MKKKKITVFLIVIILVQIIFKIYIDYNKEDLYADEMYSYGLMNYKQAFIFEEENFQENWHTKEYFNDYITIAKENKTDFSPVYNNQVEDYHPPLYYLLLRISSLFSIGKFTKWTGLILNIIIFILCDIVLFFIGKRIFKSEIYSLLLVITYGFSKFSMENTLFIRMYQLLELQLLLLTNWSLKNYHNKNLKTKDLLQLGVLIITGMLTQYYYLIFMIGIYVVNIIKYIRKKQIKNILKYVITVVISIIIVINIFPAITNQLSGNVDRSKGSSKNKTSISQIIDREEKYFKIVDENMFNIKVSYLITGLLILGIIMIIAKIIKRKRLRINKKLIVIWFPTLFYWLAITMTSPYINLRYILPIIVFILIIIMYVLKKEILFITKNKKVTLIITAIILIVYSITYWNGVNIEYQYIGNKEKIEKLQKYKDLPCIYMYLPNDVLHNNFVASLNYVRQFENTYIMNKTLYSPKTIKKNLKDKDISNGIIMINETISEKSEKYAKDIINEIDEFSTYKKIETIGTETYMDVYLIY